MKNWFKIFLIFFALGLLVYFNSLNNKFLIDDYAFIKNPFFSSTKFILSQWNPYREQQLGVLDKEAMVPYYRPMAHMALDFCYAFFKNHFWQYHLLNLFLFVFASSLIYLFIAKVNGNYHLAFLTGFFYLIHPINGIVVNYISACVFACQVIFMLGTILLLWESLERKNNRALYFLSLLFSFLALFWNESGVMTLFYVAAVILLFRKDSFKVKAIYLFPFFLIVFSYIIFRLFFLSINDFILKRALLFHMTAWECPANLFRAFMWYITQLFYPQGIVMQWASPVLHKYIFWDNLGAVSLLLLILLLFARFAKEKICRLAITWVLIGFAPACLAAFWRPDAGLLIEPHWFIFSSIGFFILAAYFFLIILGRWKKTGLALLFIVIFAWGAASHAYNQIWANQKTYAFYWSQQVPNLKSTYYYLADAYYKEGALKEAKKYYRMALSGYTPDMGIYNNLGSINQEEGHFKDAELNYKMALKIDPYMAAAYNNLGSIDFAEGRLGKAKKNFDLALMLDPMLLEPRRNLAFIFFKHSEYQKAVKLCLKNLDIVSDDPDTLFLLIDIFMREQDFVSLKKYAYRIINDATDPEILTRLGIIMSRHNIVDIALDSYTKAIRVAPDYKDAYLDAGKLFGNLGQYDAAIRIWKLGAGIDPSDQRFKKSIAKAMELKLK